MAEAIPKLLTEQCFDKTVKIATKAKTYLEDQKRDGSTQEEIDEDAIFHYKKLIKGIKDELGEALFIDLADIKSMNLSTIGKHVSHGFEEEFTAIK